MEKVADFIAQLAELVGSRHVITSESDKQPYLTENRGLYKGKALAVVRPRDATEIVQIVNVCRENGILISPQGGNTGLVGGQIPEVGQRVEPVSAIIISLSRMDTIQFVDTINGAITVEAGVTLQAVQEAAAEAGCLFPLSLASQGSCQIGGNIASNAGGTAVLRYGNMRNLVLGLEVVLPDGTLWNGMSSLRKDNAGYDLKQIFIGSEGTLGIITRAVLKLYPAVRSSTTAFIGLSSPQMALEFFLAAQDQSGEVLSAFEIMPRFGLEMVVKHMGGIDPFAEAHPFYVLIELSSASLFSNTASGMEQILESASKANIINDAVIASCQMQADKIWSLRENMSWAQKYEGGSIKHDVSVPISKVADFINQASDLCQNAMPGIRICAFGHIGDGNIHFNLSQPIGMEIQDFISKWAFFNRIVHDLVVSMGGSIAAEHGIGQLKLNELAFYKDDVSLHLMRSLKNALDPHKIMNMGKVVYPT